MVWFVNEFDITKRRVARRAAEVHEAALGEHDERWPFGKMNWSNCGLMLIFFIP